MATPETHRVELDPPAPSFDGALDAVEREEIEREETESEEIESEENQVVAAETRELSAYGFDSDDKTLVGIGTADAAETNAIRHFDSSDRTLVGIAPTDREEREEHEERAECAEHIECVECAELAGDSQQAESAPASASPPHSETPGPFVAADADDDDAPPRLPMQKGDPWLLALSAVLVAAAAVALGRGLVAHPSAPRLHAAALVVPTPTATEARMQAVPFAAAVAPSEPTAAVESPITPAPEVLQPGAPPLSAQPEKQPELTPRRVSTKSLNSQPLGVLDVSSNSASGLVLDGRPLGRAPQVIKLPSGPHTVLFVHPERGRMSVTVNVKAGRTTTASADF